MRFAWSGSHAALWLGRAEGARKHENALSRPIFEEVAAGACSAQPKVLDLAFGLDVIRPRRSEQLTLPVIKLRRALRIRAG